MKTLSDRKQSVAQYALPDGGPAGGEFPFNPNGSLNDIAGVCDSTGRVFGLMPHPEAFVHETSYPEWTRVKEIAKRKKTSPQELGFPPLGRAIFENAVSYFS